MDGDTWVFNPNWLMSPSWRIMTINGYPMRCPLVNSCRVPGTEISDPLKNNARSIDGKVADCLQSEEEAMQVFEGLSIDEAEAFERALLEIAAHYQANCNSFARRPCESTWHSFEQSYSELMAAMWLHYYWQLFLKRQSSQAANDIGMARLLFEQMLSKIQQDIPEEDVSYRNLIKEAAIIVVESDFFMAGEEVDLKHASHRASLLQIDGLEERITHMARNFRVVAATDITADLGLVKNEVLQRVLEAVQQGRTSLVDSREHSESLQIDYYPVKSDASTF